MRSIYHVAKSIFFSGKFGSVSGERFRFCPLQGVRDCVNLHLFIDFIHDCCNHTTPLFHLQQVNTKILIYNCYTALKHKNFKTGLATHFIQYNPRKQQSVMFTKISNSSRRNCKRAHIKVY